MRNSDGGSGLAREERLQIMLSPKELEAVDTFRFLHRMPSRAAAVRELLRHGIANVKNYGDVQHPLYHVLQVISKNLYRKDPFKILPPELWRMILSHISTMDLV